MKIVADENIALVEDYFGAGNELILKPGRAIVREDLLDAAILLVRSVTLVNEKLLQGTPIKFVGSATAGVDHLDIAWLNQAKISWSAAPECNAAAVAEYVICAIAALRKMNFLLGKKPRAGVVGVGAIGKRVVNLLQQIGFEVVLCDPVRAQTEKSFHSTALDDFTDLDLVTLHTPLTYQGECPTFHMVEKNFLQRQKKNTVLINTGRGSVIDFAALKKYGKHLILCLDVWENEPHIDLDILQSAVIATPHIAGYSIQAKMRGTEMIYHAACEKKFLSSMSKKIEFPRRRITLPEKSSWEDKALKIFDPRELTQKLKAAPEKFDWLRKEFNERYEFGFVDFSVGHGWYFR